MKATGIVRRIDELGRVVIPKEVRRRLRLQEGDPMEIFVDSDGEIILKKYCVIGDLGERLQEYVSILHKSLGHTAAICNMNAVIAASGPLRKQLMNQNVHNNLILVMQKSDSVQVHKGNCIDLIQDQPDSMNLSSQTIVPISDTDHYAIGAIIVLTDDPSAMMGQVDLQCVEMMGKVIKAQVSFS